ncbi:hypothetical protein PCL_06237 [Purpureocillium lilacinum]|uniref:Uncharacterized protein n=1 Tax=Purpureocillium lilacinum TaxID=33203 RepID=A0A2U3EM38_PURLI|nr:hypothetical protein Purlil1_4116 [Purpureocillium lilacinum]PWI75579.1 hypothetical protein PCL_06237 [Purpureocillium lilacinum]
MAADPYDQDLYYSDAGGGQCLEPCCSAYLHDFGLESSYQDHINHKWHLAAKAAGRDLLAMDLSDEELEQRRLALRELRCDESHCPLYGRVMPGGHGAFYGHRESAAHLGIVVDTNNPPPWRCERNWETHEVSECHVNALRIQVARNLRGQRPLPPTTAATRNGRRRMRPRGLTAREAASLYLGATDWTAPAPPPPPPTNQPTQAEGSGENCPEVVGEPSGRPRTEVVLEIQMFVERQGGVRAWPRIRDEFGL